MAFKRQAAALETRPARELDLAKQQQIAPTISLTAIVSQDPGQLAETRALGPGAITLTFLGEPVAKGRPRLTKRGIAYTPVKTRAFERALGYTARAAMHGRARPAGPVRLTVEITLAVPKSWPARKKIDALCGWLQPTSKPDLDNYAKAASDGITGIVIGDDAQVIELIATKAYGQHPQIRITVEPIDDSRRS